VNAVVHNVAVGDKAGKGILSFDSDQSALATLTGNSTRLPRKDVPLANSLEVKIISLDEFCLEKSITKIDYMKIDVEGYEYNVLCGASSLIEQKKIRAIAFEFGLNHIRLRQFFRMFWDFFEKYDYKVSLMRRGENGFDLLPIPEYVTTWENFNVNRIFVATVKT
jgi:FkbM family methyltransferase